MLSRLKRKHDHSGDYLGFPSLYSEINFKIDPFYTLTHHSFETSANSFFGEARADGRHDTSSEISFPMFGKLVTCLEFRGYWKTGERSFFFHFSVKSDTLPTTLVFVGEIFGSYLLHLLK
jgi:hypothetical protein